MRHFVEAFHVRATLTRHPAWARFDPPPHFDPAVTRFDPLRPG